MRSGVVALAVPALLLALLPGAASASGPQSAAAAHRAAVIAHWTPARIAAAQPRDFVLEPGRGLVPRARPGGGSGGVIGASWTGGGAILEATGRVLFSLPSGDYICSGSVVSDGSTQDDHSIVLTAGHCATENDGKTFASDWIFYPEFDTDPSYNCEARQGGCWVADALYADKDFYTAGGFNNQAVTHDWAFAVVSSGGPAGTQLDATVGHFDIAYSGVNSGDTLWAFGYPAAGKYHGKDLVYCMGPIGVDPNTDATWSMKCDMTGGSSGGPWVSTTDPRVANGTVLRSLNSYGYSNVKNTMFGPQFNDHTQAVFTAADGGPVASTVVFKTLP